MTKENKIKNVSSSENLEIGLQTLLEKSEIEKQQIIHQINLPNNINKFVTFLQL